ncbi:MAG: site-2 protease family protein, partial [Candidatus Gracilibacteria bacterium]
MEFLYFIIALLIAIVIHEFSHAYTADALGDPTPRLAGRISLNPLKHLDIVGTIMLLIINFGWGKPVPTNPKY